MTVQTALLYHQLQDSPFQKILQKKRRPFFCLKEHERVALKPHVSVAVPLNKQP